MDTMNKFFVGIQGDNVAVLNPPRGLLSKDDAIIFAAWLVTMAGDYDGERFNAAFDAVKST